jgi:cobalt-zinc-cadmium efflux system membrane fusion protein
LACNTEEKNTTQEEPITENIDTTIAEEIVPISKNIESFGQISVPPNAITEIYAKANGFLTNLNQLEGAQINKEQILASIESADFANWKNEFIAAKENYEWQESNFERVKKLFNGNAISEKEYDDVKKNFTLASSNYLEMKNKLISLGFTENQLTSKDNLVLQIRANTNGKLVHIGATNGMNVSEQTHLFTIVDKSKLHIEMKVNVEDVNFLKTNQAFFILHHSDTIRGKIAMINEMLDNDNTVKVYGHFIDNTKTNGLIVGQQFFVEIEKE